MGDRQLGQLGGWVFPAELWVMYAWSGDEAWKTVAEQRMAGMEQEKDNTTTHDIGFMVGLPYLWAYDLTGNDEYREVLLDASASLFTRYSEVVGAIRSWSWGSYGQNQNFAVIIDNMMNLEMLMRASDLEGGEEEWTDGSIQHSLTSAEQHIREDGSTYHVVIFDENTGVLRSRETFQGKSDESTWSRGQAWGIYGYTVMYRETGDVGLLETARELADYFLEHLTDEQPIPPYDFDTILSWTARDTSAASITASALIELSQLETDAELADVYLGSARKILFHLTHPQYLARDAGKPGILYQASSRHGSYEQMQIYGDYYFLEALLRYVRLMEEQ